MTLDTSQIARAADILAAARGSGELIDDLPVDCRPNDLADAEAIQEALNTHLGGAVVGYKLGFTAPAAKQLPGYAGPMLGRLFAGRILASPATIARADIVNPVIEAEIGYRMAQDLPPRDSDYGEIEVLEAVDSAVLTIEVVSAGYRDIFKVAPLGLIADNGVAHSLVVGPDVIVWQGLDLAGFAVELLFDGTRVGEELSGAARCEPASVLHWTANRLAATGGGLKAGDVITTGAAAAPAPLGDARAVVASFIGIGEVAVEFT